MQLAGDFGAALSALAPDFGPSARLALAVSGGGDSYGMLALAADLLPDRITVFTIDHRLRAASGQECEAVLSACAVRGIPAERIDLDWPSGVPQSNRQAQAREARYRVLTAACAERGLTWLATAHHADDQAETFLMRAARGSGLSGLAGVRARRRIGELVLLRPCLGMRSETLHQAARAAGFIPIEDPSNSDPSYDRSGVRALLEGTDLLPAERLAAAASHLADAEEALAWLAKEARRTRCWSRGDELRFDARGLPSETVLRVVRSVILDLGGELPRGTQAQRLVETLGRGGRASLSNVQASGGAVWTFRRENDPRRA
ncbi:tRNA lysidine(34) synthetase TilS [Pacificimonas flava]|uniref:tRNA(Ile)-lysidine synthase n=2 Tax=Pacificimonas TaxID=1960290 RepID=A0A219B225_9SPHN|nr:MULTISPECIES: tRNA lysidine(34) synthetase TilS [Pacificimonas]MBZ6377956.1 tRNA lysidine(34) synthetase TilS [Pacificimonas aurantium]OWV32391.1 tRNA lysidine(34) synthetase TilS [Pacificimonas flava]